MSIILLAERRKAQEIATRLEVKMPRELAALVRDYLSPGPGDEFKVQFNARHWGDWRAGDHRIKQHAIQDAQGNHFLLRCEADVDSSWRESPHGGSSKRLILSNLNADLETVLNRIADHIQTMIPHHTFRRPLLPHGGRTFLPAWSADALDAGRYWLILRLHSMVERDVFPSSCRLWLTKAVRIGPSKLQLSRTQLPKDSDSDYVDDDEGDQ